jgi:hypothetical protein
LAQIILFSFLPNFSEKTQTLNVENLKNSKPWWPNSNLRPVQLFSGWLANQIHPLPQKKLKLGGSPSNEL